MNYLKTSGASLKKKGEDESPQKNNPPFEVPEREEGEEYISINDDPKKIDIPRS
jgi:hypothetical protein